MLVMTFEFCPRMTEWDEHEAPDDRVLRSCVVAVHPRHQPTVGSQRYVHLLLTLSPPDFQVDGVLSCVPFGDKMLKMDPLVVPERDCTILADLDAINLQEDIIFLQAPRRGSQRPHLCNAHARRASLGEAKHPAQRRALQRLHFANTQGRDAMVARRRIPRTYAGDELLQHLRWYDVADVRGILQVARRHADNFAVAPQHGAAGIAWVDRCIYLDPKQAVQVHVDARDHASGDGDVLPTDREADARHVVVEPGYVPR
mmetsp:Transcript_7895/g.18137  ORF Transcript_7895/g.18137 Transcript_7895/m.18137 type:complete len:257 (+) Transcript_7895:419-1189(+)